MISVVSLEANVEGNLHSHPEEQWGLLLEGDAVRIQAGKEVPVGVGDFWRTPGGVPHAVRAGNTGARILDIFSPPREAYRKSGQGFAPE
jgi:quercetin dioxygenase-like cupin family protein